MKHKKLLAATMVASALLASSNSYAKEDTVVVNDNFEPKSSTADIDAKLKVQMKLDSIEKSKQKSNVDISEATEEYDFMNLPVWDENTGKILNPSKNKIKGTITGAARQVIGDGETLTITTNTADVKNNDSVLNGGAIYNELGTLNINGSSETIEISGNTADNESNFCTYGGAIYNAGTATITNAKFTSNRARRSGGYDISYGGAISNADYEYTDANVKMVINNTIFGDPDDPTKGNIARTGGAIYNSDEEHLADIPGYEDYATKITLNNTSFYYNKAAGFRQ